MTSPRTTGAPPSSSTGSSPVEGSFGFHFRKPNTPFLFKYIEFAMRNISVKRATTIADLSLAARIRCAVFADEFAYLNPSHYPAGREVDGFDLLPTTVNFIGLVDEEPAATVRLLFPNADVAKRCNIERGLNIERALDLHGIGPDMKLAEIPRSSVLKPYRRTGIMRHLYFAAYEETIVRGCTHWVAEANTETDCEADVCTVHRLLQERGYWLQEFGAAHRGRSDHPAVPRYPLYSCSQREQVQRGDFAGAALPRTLELFATKISARYFGVAFFDCDFHMFAMPLMVLMSEFAQSPYGSLREIASPEAMRH
jgi:GNAT superfamily N-acetyltransferase